jgi:Trypsin-co-occurring domain 1
MSELHRLLIEENGKTLEIYVESPPLPSIPTSSKTGERPGAKSATDEVFLKMAEVQEKILAYANFAIGAFQHLGAAEVEEISLKFGIKLGGKTGIIFTEGSAEGSMEVSVKCKFPKTNSASHQS